MTSVLAYSLMTDPFASHAAMSQQAQAAMRYSSPPLSPSSGAQSPHQSFTPTSNSSRAASTTPATSPPTSSSTRMPTAPTPDEFGTYAGPGKSQSTSAARPRTSLTHSTTTMPLPLAGPVASTSATTAHAYAFNSSAGSATTPPNAAAARKRQSHNPSSALNPIASPPKAEHLTDEYILHPSVYAWRAAHAKRPMVAFGPYVLLQTLGEGEFGKVKLGVHTEYGVEVAIKLIRRGSLDDEARASKVEREIDVLKVSTNSRIS